MTVDVLPITDVKVGARDRSDLGDIAALAASIKAVGLLHPLVVTASHELVAGDRRLSAIRSLGWSEVPVTIVDLTNVADVLRAEADENTCRKSLTPYEADVARERREQVLRADAKARQGTRTDKEPSSKLDGSPSSRATRKAAAIGTGYSGSTLDKVRKIRKIAETGETTSGVPVPTPVQDVAVEALEDVKLTGAAIDAASKKVDRALSEFIEESSDVKAAVLRSNVMKEIAKFRLASFPADHVADALDDDLWDSIRMVRDDLDRWVDSVAAARPQNLRVVKG